ncbi:transposase [Kitasatospora azatica]|uniref:transposase n=1 Tax=Kitasatospora azatica TaxID=58347 RepID=UPI0009FCA6A8
MAAGGSIQYLEALQRAHGRVEDHIRCGKTTRFGRFPSRHFAINQAWLELSLTAIDLLARARTLLLEGGFPTAEPKKLRYRILHAAPGSPAEPVACTCGSQPSGPGATNWPPRSADSWQRVDQNHSWWPLSGRVAHDSRADLT